MGTFPSVRAGLARLSERPRFCPTLIKVMATKRFNYRAYPTRGQARLAARLFGCCRVVANDFIAANQTNYRAGRPYQSAYTLISTLLTKTKQN